MLFKQKVLLSFLTIATIWGVWIAIFAIVRDEDIVRLKALSKEAAIVKNNAAAPIYQNRWGVSKDIYVSETSTSRLHHHIKSVTSVLTLKEQNGKLEVVEELQDMHAWIQEKIYQHKETHLPMHNLRYFEARQGVYRHHHQDLVATDIDLFLYQLPGKDLVMNLNPYSHFLKGKAAQIHFFVSNNLTNFNAENFQAQFETIRNK